MSPERIATSQNGHCSLINDSYLERSWEDPVGVASRFASTATTRIFIVHIIYLSVWWKRSERCLASHQISLFDHGLFSFSATLLLHPRHLLFIYIHILSKVIKTFHFLYYIMFIVYLGQFCKQSIWQHIKRNNNGVAYIRDGVGCLRASVSYHAHSTAQHRFP